MPNILETSSSAKVTRIGTRIYEWSHRPVVGYVTLTDPRNQNLTVKQIYTEDKPTTSKSKGITCVADQ